MNQYAVMGLTVTLVYALEYGIKPRRWRKWLGILIGGSSIFAMFTLPFHIYETDIGLIYVMMGISGWYLFYDSDRFDKTD